MKIKNFISIVLPVLIGGDTENSSRKHRSNVNHAAAAIMADHGTNNFATIRTTSIVTKQQKEHMQVSRCLDIYKIFVWFFISLVIILLLSRTVFKQLTF